MAHLSKENNLPDLAKKTTEEYLKSKNIIKDIDYKLDIAPRYDAGKIYDL